MREFARQVARHYRRQQLLKAISLRFELSELTEKPGSETVTPTVPPSAPELLSPTSPTARYHISTTTAYPISLRGWLAKHDGDPALIVSQFSIYNKDDSNNSKSFLGFHG
jgi:hypothetical protein